MREKTFTYLAIACFAIICYPLGSNTGLTKMGYLSFLIITPALYNICEKQIPDQRKRTAFLIFTNITAIIYIYSTTYRDDLKSILKTPSIINDSTLGFVLTTQKNKSILNSFKNALNSVDAKNSQIIISPYAPLLAAYIEDYDIRISWPDIRPESLLRDILATRCGSQQQQLLFISRSNLASITREPIDPNKLSRVPSLWKKYCGWNLIYENMEFYVFKGFPTKN